jgi:filamentous hemagglutinin family protein
VSDPITIGSQTQYNITGGTRPGGGTNLFHGFGDFTVPTNNIANFVNESGLATSNILGRVTGGNISNIFGTIQTTGFAQANLFLMNPAGFLFGPTATVNVGGMVSFSSADYLRLADDKLFNAVPNPTADAVLSTAPVAAYGFLGSNPGAITVQGSQFTVTAGQSISLVGGNIAIQSGTPDGGTVQSAKLSAPGGQINLASVASPGEILTGTLAQAPNINGQSFGNLGSIHVSEQSVIDVSGNGGGTVLIRAGQFLVDNSAISANITGSGPIANGVESIGRGVDIVVSQDAVIQNGGLIETSVVGNATEGVKYGGISINADRIDILGSQDFENFPLTGVIAHVNEGSTGGNGGDINLEANTILGKEFGTFTTFVETITSGAGNAGNITLRTNGDIKLDGVIFVESFGNVGNAGNIELTSRQGNILMTNGPFISSQSGRDGSGTVGSISVNASNGDILMTGSPDFGPATLFTHIDGTGANAGKGGIKLTAKNLTIENSGIQIDHFSEFEPGGLTVSLTGRLTLRGSDIFPSTLLTTTRRFAQAPELNITAHDIQLTDGSLIASETLRAGNGGELNILTETLQLANGAQIRSSSRLNPFPPPDDPGGIPSGAGGTVTIRGGSGTAESVLIDGSGSGIFTNTEGTGAGGNILVNSSSVTLQNGGTLSAATTGTASSATGGTITVNAEHVAVNSQASITTDTNGIAPAGTVDINTGTLAINSGGQIRSSSGAETEQVSALAFSLTAAPTLTGGTITIQGRTGTGSQADTVTIDGPGSGVFTESTGTRPGGDISLLTSQSVTMTNGASISSSSTGTGDAGNININAGNQFAMTNSSVTTEANRASGGAIKITTTPGGTVQLTDSTITASVLDGTGGGGSVDIDPQFVILQNSQILANSVFGPGGNISITTNLLLPDTTSIIDASSQFGQQGTIVIQSPVSPASGKLVPLGQKPLIAAALVSQRCAALAGGNASSFTVAGRDSLPAEPAGWVSSPLALSMVETNEDTATETGLSSFSEMAGETPLLSLRRVAPAGFLTQSFGAASSDCQS